ncbi:hypothetical protein [Lactovum miscens]|uniref:hypothetical protein n=1 Tax=Lactovum miscens TaxID=190387 RepID=UPI002EDB75B6
MDIFENSVIIDKKVREELSVQVSNYFRDLNQYIDTFEIPTNIYYSGSLSRKEPSVVKNDNGYELVSDFDFVFVVHNDQERDKYYQAGITKLLNNEFPHYKNSVVILRVDDLKNFSSRIGENLYQGLKSPVRQEFIVPKIVAPVVTKEDYLESLINIMAILLTMSNWKSKSQLFKAGDNYYKSKLLVESFKLPILAQNTKEVINNFSSIASFLSLEEFIMILKSRELNNTLDFNFNISRFLSQIISKSFGYENISDFLISKSKLANDFLKQAQLLFLILFFKNESLDLKLFKILETLKKDILFFKKFNNDLIKLRVDYMLELHYRNTKTSTSSLPDLKEDNL